MTHEETVEEWLGMYGPDKSYPRKALRFVGPTLYSYGQPIAKKIDHTNIWVTSKRYSCTTSRHVNMLIRTAQSLNFKVTRYE